MIRELPADHIELLQACLQVFLPVSLQLRQSRNISGKFE